MSSDAAAPAVAGDHSLVRPDVRAEQGGNDAHTAVVPQDFSGVDVNADAADIAGPPAGPPPPVVGADADVEEEDEEEDDKSGLELWRALNAGEIDAATLLLRERGAAALAPPLPSSSSSPAGAPPTTTPAPLSILEDVLPLALARLAESYDQYGITGNEGQYFRLARELWRFMTDTERSIPEMVCTFLFSALKFDQPGFVSWILPIVKRHPAVDLRALVAQRHYQYNQLRHSAVYYVARCGSIELYDMLVHACEGDSPLVLEARIFEQGAGQQGSVVAAIAAVAAMKKQPADGGAAASASAPAAGGAPSPSFSSAAAAAAAAVATTAAAAAAAAAAAGSTGTDTMLASSSAVAEPPDPPALYVALRERRLELVRHALGQLAPAAQAQVLRVTIVYGIIPADDHQAAETLFALCRDPSSSSATVPRGGVSRGADAGPASSAAGDDAVVGVSLDAPAPQCLVDPDTLYRCFCVVGERGSGGSETSSTSSPSSTMRGAASPSPSSLQMRPSSSTSTGAGASEGQGGSGGSGGGEGGGAGPYGLHLCCFVSESTTEPSAIRSNPGPAFRYAAWLMMTFGRATLVPCSGMRWAGLFFGGGGPSSSSSTPATANAGDDLDASAPASPARGSYSAVRMRARSASSAASAAAMAAAAAAAAAAASGSSTYLSSSSTSAAAAAASASSSAAQQSAAAGQGGFLWADWSPLHSACAAGAEPVISTLVKFDPSLLLLPARRTGAGGAPPPPPPSPLSAPATGSSLQSASTTATVFPVRVAVESSHWTQAYSAVAAVASLLPPAHLETQLYAPLRAVQVYSVRQAFVKTLCRETRPLSLRAFRQSAAAQSPAQALPPPPPPPAGTSAAGVDRTSLPWEGGGAGDGAASLDDRLTAWGADGEDGTSAAGGGANDGASSTGPAFYYRDRVDSVSSRQQGSSSGVLPQQGRRRRRTRTHGSSGVGGSQSGAQPVAARVAPGPVAASAVSAAPLAPAADRSRARGESAQSGADPLSSGSDEEAGRGGEEDRVAPRRRESAENRPRGRSDASAGGGDGGGGATRAGGSPTLDDEEGFQRVEYGGRRGVAAARRREATTVPGGPAAASVPNPPASPSSHARSPPQSGGQPGRATMSPSGTAAAQSQRRRLDAALASASGASPPLQGRAGSAAALGGSREGDGAAAAASSLSASVPRVPRATGSTIDFRDPLSSAAAVPRGDGGGGGGASSDGETSIWPGAAAAAPTSAQPSASTVYETSSLGGSGGWGLDAGLDTALGLGRGMASHPPPAAATPAPFPSPRAFVSSPSAPPPVPPYVYTLTGYGGAHAGMPPSPFPTSAFLSPATPGASAPPTALASPLSHAAVAAAASLGPFSLRHPSDESSLVGLGPRGSVVRVGRYGRFPCVVKEVDLTALPVPVSWYPQLLAALSDGTAEADGLAAVLLPAFLVPPAVRAHLAREAATFPRAVAPPVGVASVVARFFGDAVVGTAPPTVDGLAPTAGLSSPGAADAVGAGSRLLLALEHCTGGTVLAAARGAGATVGGQPAIGRLAAHVAGAVAALHGAGIVHGGLCPSNVLLARAWTGQAAAAAAAGSPPPPSSSSALLFPGTSSPPPAPAPAPPVRLTDPLLSAAALVEACARSPYDRGIRLRSVLRSSLAAHGDWMAPEVARAVRTAALDAGAGCAGDGARADASVTAVLELLRSPATDAYALGALLCAVLLGGDESGQVAGAGAGARMRGLAAAFPTASHGLRGLISALLDEDPAARPSAAAAAAALAGEWGW
jgi:trimeric autotransporter adhesin